MNEENFKEENRKAGKKLRHREIMERIIAAAITVHKALEDIHLAIARSYLKAANLEDGLLLNFATMPLTIKRIGGVEKLSTKSHSLFSNKFLFSSFKFKK